jgi:hypothetical protein
MGRSFVREPNVRAESVAAVVSPSVTGKRRGDSLFSREALMLVSACLLLQFCASCESRIFNCEYSFLIPTLTNEIAHT